MLDILQTALSVVYPQSSDGSPVACLLEKYSNATPKNRQMIFLNLIGMYKSEYAYSIEDMDLLYEEIGHLQHESILFAESLFDIDIQKFNCSGIGEKLKHRFLADIQDIIKPRVFNRLLVHPRMPQFFETAEIEALIPGNFEAYPYITQQGFLSLINSSTKNCVEDSLNTEELLLAEQLKKQIICFKETYTRALMPLEFGEEDAEHIKLMTASYLMGAYRCNALKQFIAACSEGGLLFFSCLLFVEDQEKLSNRDFWREYYRWLKIDDASRLRISQTKLNRLLREYWDENGIIYTTSPGSGQVQYVLSLRMHAIVANRPLSKGLITKFLLKIVKESGVFFHDNEDQRELIKSNLDEYTISLVDDIDSGNTTNRYLQLPRETAQAYCYTPNSSQVVDFLIPIYDCIERLLVAHVNRGPSIGSFQSIGVPAFLIPSIEKALQETSIDELNKLRTRAVQKKQIGGKIVLLLDLTKFALCLSVPTYLFFGLGAGSEIEFYLYESEHLVYKKSQIVDECIGTTVYTKEFVLPLQNFTKDLNYQFKSLGKILKSGTIPFCPIFDAQGYPLHFPCSIAQPVYCIAKSGDIVADGLVQLSGDPIGNLHIWETYLANATPIIIGNKLYGIESAFWMKKAGSIIKHDAYQQVEFSSNKIVYPVIGEYPLLFLRYASDISISMNIVVIIDDLEVPFIQLSSTLIDDGRGESFYRIQIDPSILFPNAKLLHLRIFSLAEKKDLINETYFCLRNLSYEFSRAVYLGLDEVEITSLGFDEQERLFKNRSYGFPTNLTKFKLNLKDANDNRLTINPPVVKVEAEGESLFQHDCWYEELVSHEKISVELPRGYVALSLATVDSSNNCMHILKIRGGLFQTTYLSQPPETEEPFVTLRLLIANESKQKANITVCRIYYKVAEKDCDALDFIFYPPSLSFRYTKGKPGLKISKSFYCGKRKEYLLKIIGVSQKAVISGKLDTDGRFLHHQENNLAEGNYSLCILEKSINSFTNEQVVTEVYNKAFYYKSHTADAVQLKCAKDRTSIEFDLLSQWHTIQFYFTVKRVINTDSTISYNRVIQLRSFFIEAAFDVRIGSEFSATGFFYTRDNRRIDLSIGNPFTVRIAKILSDQSLICSINDCTGKPLRVGERSGFVNAFQDERDERDCECHLFSGRLSQ